MCHVSHVNFGTLKMLAKTPQNPWVFDGFSFQKSLIQEPPMVRCSNVTRSNRTEAEAEQSDGFSDPPVCLEGHGKGHGKWPIEING